MALFSVNQNAQWFTPTDAEITELKKTANTSTLLKKAIDKVWFSAKSGKNTHTSEIVNTKNHGYIKYVTAASMSHNAKVLKLTMNSGVNSGTPIANEVYGIYINQRGYHALGENEFMELGAEVRYGSSFDLGNGPEVLDSAADLLNALALAFVRNLGADNDLYRVVVATASNAAATEVTPSTDLHSTSTVAIYILEKEQDWIQGTMQRENVDLVAQNAFLSNITVNTVERDDWGTLEDYTIDTTKSATSGYIEAALTTASIPYTWVNSKDIADMEWFYLGEHGDTQRLMGYPYVNPSQINNDCYNINANSTNGYDLIVVHHAYVGNGTFVQKSEQDIMIAVEANKDSNAGGLNIAKAIEAALTGTSATLTNAGGIVTF